MKPRFQHAIYPLSGKRLWIVFTQILPGTAMHTATLDAEEAAAFWKY